MISKLGIIIGAKFFYMPNFLKKNSLELKTLLLRILFKTLNFKSTLIIGLFSNIKKSLESEQSSLKKRISEHTSSNLLSSLERVSSDLAYLIVTLGFLI